MELESFVYAIRSGEPEKIERWSQKARAVMVKYLTLRYNANTSDAEDCAQETLLKVVEMVQQDTFEADNYGGYIITMLRNEYIRVCRQQARLSSDYLLEEHYYTIEEDPARDLLKAEMMDSLQECIQELKGRSRKLIEYFLKFPDIRAVDIASELEVSANSIWTRRHRVFTKLLNCVENKI